MFWSGWTILYRCRYVYAIIVATLPTCPGIDTRLAAGLEAQILGALYIFIQFSVVSTRCAPMTRSKYSVLSIDE